MKRAKPQSCQLKAFMRGVKPGIYEVWRGRLVEGKFVNEELRRSWAWRRYFRKFNQVLQNYNYVHKNVVSADGVTYQSFYIYRENTQGITPEMLANVQECHSKIGLAVGIPEFAVKDFVTRKAGEKLVKVKIKRLGLVFTMRDNKENQAKLEEFLAEKG